MNWLALLTEKPHRLPRRLWRKLRLALDPNARGQFTLAPGVRFEVPLASALARLLLLEVYERAEQAFVRQALAPGAVFLDVGANHGLFTVLAAERVGAAGHVYAFEPSPREAASLRRNLALNQCTNVTVVEQAVSDRTGQARLAVAGDGGLNALAQNTHPEQVVEAWQAVSTITLDDYLAGAGEPRVDLLKIDVEGAEALVLRGAERLLRRAQPPVLLCEFCDVTAAGFGSSGRELYALLTSYGYELLAPHLDEAGRVHLTPAPPADHYDYLNLIARRAPNP